MDGEFVDAEGPRFGKQFVKRFFRVRKFHKKAGLPAIGNFAVFPSHNIANVGGRLYQGGFVGFYQEITACGKAVGKAAGNGKHIAVVTVGQFGGDQGAAFFVLFHHHYGIDHPGHNAVAFGKIFAVGIGF